MNDLGMYNWTIEEGEVMQLTAYVRLKILIDSADMDRYESKRHGQATEL